MTEKKLTTKAAMNRAFASLAAEALSRSTLAGMHGQQYGGRRDIYKAAGYPRTLAVKDFVALYDRDPIAARIVDMPSETTWRLPPSIEQGEVVKGKKREETAFTKAVEQVAQKVGLWRKLPRLDRSARLGRYAVMLIGTGADDQALKTEMRKLTGPEDVLYLAVYREDHALIKEFETDQSSERYGLPKMYEIDFAGSLKSAGRSGLSKALVHWSHLIHVAERTLEDDVYGVPTLQRPFNALHDLMKVTASTAEAFWQRVAGALIGSIDPAAQGVDDDVFEALDEQMKELYHDLRRVIFGQGITVSRLAETEPDPSAAAKLYLTLAAAGEGIPLRMLVGNETGERASSEDQKSWFGVAAERQIQHAEPSLLRPFIERLVERGALPDPGAEGYDVIWPELFKQSEGEIATANKDRALAAATLTPVGGDPMLLVEIDEDRNIWLRQHGEGDTSPFDELMNPPTPDPGLGDPALDGPGPLPPTGLPPVPPQPPPPIQA